MRIDRRTIFILSIIVLSVSVAIGYSYIETQLSSSDSNIILNKYSCDSNNLYERLLCKGTLDSVRSDDVKNNTGVDFNQLSSYTNGSGVYLRAITLNDTYPMAYMRGAAHHSMVDFNDMCWNILHTTETGGTKLLYRGEKIDTTGDCGDNNLKNLIINDTDYSFNTSSDSLAYVGYMYGDVYKSQKISTSDDYVYSNSFGYSNGEYHLDSLKDTFLFGTIYGDNRYTCFNSTGTCTSIKYIYHYDNEYYYYLELSNGEGIKTAINNMKTNTNSSTIKSITDSWYSDKMSSKNLYIEDRGYCGDRSFNKEIEGSDQQHVEYTQNGFVSPGGNNPVYFGAYGRRVRGEDPTFTCSESNDNYNSRVGQITYDDVILAGGRENANSTLYFLNGKSFWTMTPRSYNSMNSQVFRVSDEGDLSGRNAELELGIRPVITLKNTVEFDSGTGSYTKPYHIIYNLTS